MYIAERIKGGKCRATGQTQQIYSFWGGAQGLQKYRKCYTFAQKNALSVNPAVSGSSACCLENVLETRIQEGISSHSEKSKEVMVNCLL